MRQNGTRGFGSDVGYDSGLCKIGLAWVKIEACTRKQVQGFLEPTFFYLRILIRFVTKSGKNELTKIKSLM